jgi:hypothetical protein
MRPIRSLVPFVAVVCALGFAGCGTKKKPPSTTTRTVPTGTATPPKRKFRRGELCSPARTHDYAKQHLACVPDKHRRYRLK